ncbi:MAG: hypothetical protein LUI09_01735 [Prevotellaceae bacterium]|nr:hypothetical protein [Prevotellaceae bacterium]
MLRPNGISQSGEQNNIHGNNIKGSGEGELGKALDEIAAQRKLTEKAQDEIAAQQRLTEKAQEQTDRLLSIIERMQQGN